MKKAEFPRVRWINTWDPRPKNAKEYKQRLQQKIRQYEAISSEAMGLKRRGGTGE